MSGGEIQRLKLAAELYKSKAELTIFLLDEPSTGLHLQDIQPLWNHLRELSNAGHAVVFVEHHPDMLRLADWVIELGPGGGNAGGYLISQSSTKLTNAISAASPARFVPSFKTLV